ncbi:hypothetical protein TorRG33x02_147050 [Trema orientale]|uniref:Uncharacterized protein n=1 Tax=Trema orientale TaxID=63057 RepID=A0A2P5EVK0_TREOI|nr:hypothetical protein TorRG33x02_147050 [Trema orientale]
MRREKVMRENVVRESDEKEIDGREIQSNSVYDMRASSNRHNEVMKILHILTRRGHQVHES